MLSYGLLNVGTLLLGERNFIKVPVPFVPYTEGLLECSGQLPILAAAGDGDGGAAGAGTAGTAGTASAGAASAGAAAAAATARLGVTDAIGLGVTVTSAV